MRRSARETKKPEVFSFPDSESAHRKEEDTDEEDNMDSSQSISKPQPKKKDFTLFNSVGGESVGSARNLGPDLTKWINHYKANRVSAMVDLVNFILLSAGSGKKWIESDVDLEALEPEELDVLLSDMMRMMSESENSKDYPLTERSKSKGGKSYRDKYKAFWVSWVERLLSLPREDGGRRIIAHDILRTVADQLVALSSMAVVNIRDAVTEAALSVAQALLHACAGLRAKLETARRQIAAEESSRSKAAAQQNPKYQACLKQRDSAAKDLEVLMDFSNTIFNSILLHRIKDFHDEVRATAIRHVLDFVRFDLKRPIHIEHLKYLGWACSDYAAAVRLEAVRAIHSLAQDQEVVPCMCSFVEVFVDRFIEIASRDIDDHVALEMVQAMRTMQSAGLLDSISEEKLDVVDVIVFDTEASARVRQEALAFLMDHTEGFEEEPGEDSTDFLDLSLASLSAKAGKGKKAGAQSKTDQAKALARRQRVAQQLETLTEYAEHHLGGSLERSHMLAESCLALRKLGIVYNWSTIIALLLRETDDVIRAALRPAQASILLRMFVHCAADLNQQRLACAEGVSLNSAERQTLQCWESLNENLHAHLPALLTHFQDDEGSLAVLVDLLPCVDYAAEERACKAALGVLLELLQLTRSEGILTKLVAALCSWTRIGGTIAGSVESAVRGVVTSSWQTVLSGTTQLQAVIARRETDSTSTGKKSAGKRKSKGGSQEDDEETLLSLQSALVTLKLFWAQLDCRPYFKASVSEMTDELAEVTEHVPTFAEGEQHLSASLTEACIAASNAAVAIIHSAVLWSYKDVLDLGRKMVAAKQRAVTAKPARKGASASSQVSQVSDDTSEMEEQFERSISLAVDAVVAQREKLVDILLTWISLEDAADADGPRGRVLRALQLEAFRLISDLRNFFPLRETQYKYIGRLAYTPSQEILAGIRKVFETEGGRIQAQLSGLNQHDPENARAVSELSRSLIECILEPVSSNVVFDVEHLNRKQASAVIYYLLNANELVEEKIKAFMRKLKDASLMKYMEIQLIALRDLYIKHVAAPMQARLAAETDAEEGAGAYFDFEASDDLLQEGFAKVDTLAKKLAQSMGVAKFKDDALELLMKFFKACVDFSLADVLNVGFAGCLAHYLRFLQPASQRELQDYLALSVEGNADVADELEAQRARGAVEDQQGGYLGYAKLLEFVERVQGKSRPKMTRRKASTGAGAVDYSMEDSHILESPARAKLGAGRGAGAAGRGKAAPVRVGMGSQMAASSQALQQEDLALIAGGHYPAESRKQAAKGAKGKAAGGRQASSASQKSRPAAGNSARGAKRGRKTQEVSSDEEEDEDVADSEEGSAAEEEPAEESYQGLSAGVARRYQQRFTQGLTQTQTQTQTQKSAAKAPAAPRTARGAKASNAGTKAKGRATTAAGEEIVLGLDIEEFDEDQDVDAEEEEQDQEDISEEEDEEVVAPARSQSKKRPYSSVRSVGSAGSDKGASVAGSFAELDSVPSRRRLR